MASLAQLQTYRETAGARYEAAIVELRAAYIELASLENALNNNNVAGDGYVEALTTFRGDCDSIPVELQHPIYAPGHRSGILAEVKSAFETIIAAYPTPDS